MIKILISTFVLVAAALLHAAPPNIIYILADDMGPGDVSCYNAAAKFQTPHIDRMAREGMKFMDAHTSSSVCTPTRYGIVTGRYAWRTWLKDGVLGGHSDPLIEQGRETVASLLKAEGYATALIGKWHLGMSWENDGKPGKMRVVAKDVKNPKAPVKNGPVTLGFDYFFGLSSSLDHDPHAYMENDRLLGELFMVKGGKGNNEMKKLGFPSGRPGWIANGFKNEEVLLDLARKSREWIATHQSKPFFLMVPLTSPHNPICPRKEFQGKSGIGAHGDFCMETDWVVGEILAELDQQGLSENTMVIFTTDNGTNGGAGMKEMEKLGHFSSWMYRGSKRSIFEGGHRMPFVVRWPGGVNAGQEDGQLICTTDLLATLAELTGHTLADHEGEDSVSFLSALQGRAIPGEADRLIAHHDSNGYYAARRGKWKLVLDYSQGGKIKLKKGAPIQDLSTMLLFDMDADPGETINLLNQHPEVVESMMQGLADLIQNGRSTPGAPGKNDAPWEGKTWHQIDLLKPYMKDGRQ